MTKLNGRVARGKLRARQREKERDVHCAVFGQTASEIERERERTGRQTKHKQTEAKMCSSTKMVYSYRILWLSGVLLGELWPQ